MAVTPSARRFAVNSGAVRESADGVSFLFAVEPANAPDAGEMVLEVQNVKRTDGSTAKYTFTLNLAK